MKTVSGVLIIGLSLTVAACDESGPRGHWVKNNASQEQINRENYQCLRDAAYRETSNILAPVPGATGPTYLALPHTETRVDQYLYNNCMAAYGFRWVSSETNPTTQHEPTEFDRLHTCVEEGRKRGDIGGKDTARDTYAMNQCLNDFERRKQ